MAAPQEQSPMEQVLQETTMGITKWLVFVLFLTGCTDDPEPTQDFGVAEKCDDGRGLWVDHGYRGMERAEFEPTCKPKCGDSPVCPEGSVFWTVPVTVDDDYPSGNACYCEG